MKKAFVFIITNALAGTLLWIVWPGREYLQGQMIIGFVVVAFGLVDLYILKYLEV